jgi:hypothetical protein
MLTFGATKIALEILVAKFWVCSDSSLKLADRLSLLFRKNN